MRCWADRDASPESTSPEDESTPGTARASYIMYMAVVVRTEGCMRYASSKTRCSTCGRERHVTAQLDLRGRAFLAIHRHASCLNESSSKRRCCNVPKGSRCHSHRKRLEASPIKFRPAAAYLRGAYMPTTPAHLHRRSSGSARAGQPRASCPAKGRRAGTTPIASPRPRPRTRQLEERCL